MSHTASKLYFVLPNTTSCRHGCERWRHLIMITVALNCSSYCRHTFTMAVLCGVGSKIGACWFKLTTECETNAELPSEMDPFVVGSMPTQTGMTGQDNAILCSNGDFHHLPNNGFARRHIPSNAVLVQRTQHRET